MAKYSSANAAFVLVDGYDVASYLISVNQKPSESVLEDGTTLQSSWGVKFDVGIKDAEFSIEGFMDDSVDPTGPDVAGITETALAGFTGTSRTACVGVSGNTIGKDFNGYQVRQVDDEFMWARGEMTKRKFTFKAAAQCDSGKIIHALSADTGSSGNTQGGNAVDNAASSANGGAGYLECTALTLGGYTSVTLKIRHSTDNSTYADLITFTNVTAAPAKERLTVAGTVNRYLASSYAFNGAGAGQSITWMAGFARG